MLVYGSGSGSVRRSDRNRLENNDKRESRCNKSWQSPFGYIVAVNFNVFFMIKNYIFYLPFWVFFIVINNNPFTTEIRERRKYRQQISLTQKTKLNLYDEG